MSFNKNLPDQHQQDVIIRRGVLLGFGNREIAEMTGLAAPQIRYRRKDMNGQPTSRVSSTRNALRRKGASERSEWIISIGIFAAYKRGAKPETSSTELILTAYEDYLADYNIRRENLIEIGKLGEDLPEKVHPNVFFESCIKYVEGCLYLERCPCKLTYWAVDISDEDSDTVPRGCPCNRLAGREETLGEITVSQLQQQHLNKAKKSVAAE